MAQPQAPINNRPTLIGGYDVELKKPPSLDIYSCPICLQILKDPYHLVTCTCGANFCKTCIEPIKLKKRTCPLCQDVYETITPNVQLRRLIENEKVFCKHKEEGCSWEGELSKLESHLSDPSKPSSEKCQFHPELCNNCGKKIIRRLMVEHQESKCLRRPYQCVFCHQYSTNYSDVIENHVPVCQFAPVQCPNKGCRVSGLTRGDLTKHISECPEASVDCDFPGCNHSCLRKELGNHYQLSIPFHMGLIARHSKNERQALERRMEAKVDSLREDLEKALGAIRTLSKENRDVVKENVRHKEEIKGLRQSIASLREEIRTLTDKEENLLQEINLVKVESAKAVQQEKEDILVNCSKKIGDQVKRQVSHQLASIKREVKQENTSFVVDLNSKTDRKLHESFGMVYQEIQSLKEKTELTAGTTAVLQSDLESLASRSTNVEMRGIKKKIEELEDFTIVTLSSQLGKNPVEVHLKEFYKWNVGNEEWVSPPFYVDGYKLCLTAFVNGDPQQNAAGYFSLYAHMMKGNNDQKLSWPFLRTLVLELVHNDNESQNKKQNLPYTKEMSSKYNGRVNHAEKGKGWGFARFCSHAELNRYFHGNPEYLVIRIS